MFCQPSHSHFLVTLLFWHLMCIFQIHQKQDVKIKNIFQIPFSWREAPRQHLRQPRQDWLWRRDQETVQGTGGQVSRRDDQRMMMHCISSPWWWWHSDTVMIIGDPVVGGSGCGIFCFPEHLITSPDVWGRREGGSVRTKWCSNDTTNIQSLVGTTSSNLTLWWLGIIIFLICSCLEFKQSHPSMCIKYLESQKSHSRPRSSDSGYSSRPPPTIVRYIYLEIFDKDCSYIYFTGDPPAQSQEPSWEQGRILLKITGALTSSGATSSSRLVLTGQTFRKLIRT